MTYSQFGCCGNHQISANYVVDNLVMCENRVNTHSPRAYFTVNILNVKELAIHFCIISAAVQHYWSKFHTAFTLHQISPVLLTVFSDLYLRKGAPPLRVAAREALHHHITALPVGTHRAMLETPYFFFGK